MARHRRDEWAPGGPRPGDPADRGPRPPARARDVMWLLLTATLVAVTSLQLVRLAWTLLADAEVEVSTGGAVLGFLITVVWLLTIYWVAAGAWRRSVWGCPFEHTTEAIWERRCQRHALVDVAGDEVADTAASDAR